MFADCSTASFASLVSRSFIQRVVRYKNDRYFFENDMYVFDLCILPIMHGDVHYFHCFLEPTPLLSNFRTAFKAISQARLDIQGPT